MENEYGIIPRQGLIVWLSDTRQAKQLERYGNLHYVSKKQHYAVLYVQFEKTDELMKQIQKLSGIKRVEKSFRNEIWELYTNSGHQQNMVKSTEQEVITAPDESDETSVV